MRRLLIELTYIALISIAVVPSTLDGQVTSVPSLITQPINNEQRVTLAGNVHPLARPQFDQGAAPQDLAMDHMLLVLKSSPAQQAALDKFLADVQNSALPSYHQWITPEDFGQQFGLAAADLQKVTSWLQSQGFQIDQVSKGRNIVQFSGTAGQVQTAFHTAIHKFVVNGKEHWANVSNPQIPTAILSAVAGITSLHNFLTAPQVQVSANQVSGTQVALTSQAGSTRPQLGSGGNQVLAPADYATIYNLNPLYQAGITGSGSVIAIVGRTNINLQDVNNFRSIFGLASNPPQVIVNGRNPGDLGGGEELEAVLDTTWAGAVAPSAQVDLVVSASTNTTDGVYLSEEYIIDNNLAGVMSESFGDCEANYTQSSAATISSLAQQAAAEGITFAVAAGDSGSAGCDDNSETSASGPLSVNVLASTPYTVAVGGTQFNDIANPGQYWSSQNGAGGESAISYIPENVWNSNCIGNSCGTGSILAGGGGQSQLFSKPSWQTGVAGIPNDGVRDVPDVSLTAAGHDPYLICVDGSCSPTQGSFTEVYGTSASTPSFAAIMALVNQKTGQRQGQANVRLYSLAGQSNQSSCNASNTGSLPASNCIFNDVTVGTNAVPGEPNYNTGSETYIATAGYDLASGLGSVNAANLVNGWNGTVASPPNNWTQISGSLTQVSVGSDGTVWGINSSGQTFSYNSQTSSLQQSSISLSQVVVGSSTAVWGLTGSGSVYQFNSANQTWTNRFGTLAKLAVGYDGDVWGINAASQVFHYNSSNQSWTQVAATLSQISVGFDGSIWGLDSSNRIYRYNPGTQAFVPVSGSLTQVAVGADGDTWGINSLSQVWHFNSLTQSWNQLPGTFSQVAVGAGYNVWALTASGQIYKFDNSNQNWASVPGTLAQIGAGADGSVWGVNSAGQVYEFNETLQPSQVFHQIPGALAQIAVSPENNVWGVNAYQQIYHYNNQSQNWDQVPGALTQVAVGFGGIVWGVNAQQQIWTFSAQSQSWSQSPIPASAAAVRVGSEGSVWALDSLSRIWRFNSQGQSWSVIPGWLADLEVGVDGTVWGVNAYQQIYAYNQASQSWSQVPGALVQLSVGSASSVWGTNAYQMNYRFDPSSPADFDFEGVSVKYTGVGFDGAAWALNINNMAYQFNSQTQTWNYIAGPYAQITVAADAAIWALDQNGGIYTFR